MNVAAHYRAALDRIAAQVRAATRAPTAATLCLYLRPVNYAPLCDNARRWTTLIQARYAEAAAPRSISDLVADPMVAQGNTLDGFETIRQIRADIQGLVPTPTEFQLQLIWFVVELMARRLFGTAWDTDRVRIRRQMGWRSDYVGIGAALTGRKEGKSTGLGMAIAIVALNLPRGRIALFSRTRDQACIIKDIARDTLYAHPRIASFKLVPAGKKLTLIASRSDMRLIEAWSGSADVRCWCVACVCVYRMGCPGIARPVRRIWFA